MILSEPPKIGSDKMKLCRNLSIDGSCKIKTMKLKDGIVDHGDIVCPAVTRGIHMIDEIDYRLLRTMPCSDHWTSDSTNGSK